MQLADQPTALYRFFDRTSRLLYIGITNSVPRRFDQHHADKPWYTDVTRVTVEHHSSRTAALEAEKAAIKAEQPVYNRQHNHGGRDPLAGARTTAGKWVFASRRSGIERRTDLFLYPELDCSAMVDDYSGLDGEAQFEEYINYLQQHQPGWLSANAVPIVWSVHSGQVGGVYEAAPLCEKPPWGDFLTHYTWPRDARTGDQLDWYQLPVINDRFPEFAKALAWTPSPLQPTCPLVGILASRAGPSCLRF